MYSNYKVDDLSAKNVSPKRVAMPTWYNLVRNLSKVPGLGQALMWLSNRARLADSFRSYFGSRPHYNSMSDSLYNKLFDEFQNEIIQLSKYTNINLLEKWHKR